MQESKKYFVLAYYILVPLDNPALEVARHHAFFHDRDVKCRIYISKEGINGQMSASAEAAAAYMEWLKSDPRFQATDFKVHEYCEHVFAKCTVKVREQLVALDVKVDLMQTGEHVSPAKWKEMLEERDETTLLLDVRNQYEWKIGHFEGAELPSLETFRQFPEFAKQLKHIHDVRRIKVMMCCTGGIRCEYYSALLKQEGFQNVYQLQGGMINYGLKEGVKHWLGKLFVFDDRLAVPLSEEETEVISTCLHCGTPSDVYYNCANMDCNELYLSCLSCAEITLGCCCASCQEAPRRRPYHQGERPKPFRRWNPISLGDA
ncbi:MAG: rhodanese-related sulfurtransferase [Anaerolineae bacterium]